MSSVDEIKIGEAAALSELARPTKPATDPAPNNTNVGGAALDSPRNGPIDQADAYAGRYRAPGAPLGPAPKR